MICRYCGTAYAPGERRCEGCGGPKGPVAETLRDGSSGAMRWMSDYRHALYLAVGSTIAVIVLNLLAPAPDRGGTPLPLLSFAWMSTAVPSVLCLASVVSAAGRPWTIALNLLFSLLVWGGLFLAVLVGILVAHST